MFLCVFSTSARAGLPFYTDDSGTTDKGRFHFEFYNEFDALQTELYPNLRQNTASFKLNYGLTDTIELDLDNPYLAIVRSRLTQPKRFTGWADTNLGVKWNFHKETKDSRLPALSATYYIEFPTGDSSQSLGSGLTDHWLNIIAEKTLTERTKATLNLGVLFAGNTSTGLLGVQTTRGRVYTGGISVLRKFTEKISLGAELIGGFTQNFDLGRSQLQALAGGSYELRKGFEVDFGLLGGKYAASPVVGVQIGVSIDFPKWSRSKAGTE